MKTPRLFTSNRVELLVEALSEVVRRPLSAPLRPEVIVVQSRGMERYLSMHLSRLLGIWANCRYPFPNVFIDELFRAVIPDASKDSIFDPEVLAWRIMKALPKLKKEPGFDALKVYVEDGDEELKKLQLSAAIADTFDQYLVFRPDMIFRWEKGEEDHWQAHLWNLLIKGSEQRHRAALAREFCKRLQNLSNRGGLPERVSVFGISALPRFHMEILNAVSRFTEVNLFVMNPCKEYWGDLQSENPGLLPSLGRLGRDFMDMVIDLGWEDTSFFEEPGDDTLLHSIQSDILQLSESGAQGEKRPLPAGDRSVQIHACHSPMREVEVLRDRILDMLESDPGLKPSEILVMAPDIHLYAPYIQAVIDVPPSDPSYIPYTIADQGVRKKSLVIAPFLTMLDLAGSRFGASQVLGLLEARSTGTKFRLGEKEVELVRKWVKETRIRWGIDDRGREDAGLPPFPENTWRAGLDRLLLGYAMPGGNERVFGSILPYDPIEGSDASVLGSLLEFVESLFEWVKRLEKRRRLGEWSELLARGIDRFFDPEGEAEREMQVLRKGFRTLGSMEDRAKANYDGMIDIKTVRWHLRRSLEKEGFGSGFLAGGITFCAMLPMRSIPCKVLCLIGMGSDAFPRESVAPGFDLIVKQPRPGDRSRRNDDRYLFLEAILSAREKLYISYVGRSIQDNSAIPPSVLVSELAECIDQRFKANNERAGVELLTVHGLQPFSPRYFRGEEGFFSYSEEHCATARNLNSARIPPSPFIRSRLSAPGAEYRCVDLSDLGSFYSHPSRFLLRKRLGLHLEEVAPLPEDREPIEIKGLEKYELEKKMLQWGLEGRDLGRLFPLIKVSGQIPPGRVGEWYYEELRKGVERFTERAAAHIRGERLEDLPLDLGIGGFRLIGRVEGVYAAELVRYRHARLRGSDFLKTWILHLALNRSAPGGYPRSARIIGLGEKKGGDIVEWRFSPVEESEDLLRELLEIFWEGLMRPLHFFPEASWTYVRSSELSGRDSQESLRRGWKTWAGSEWERGEREDPYHRMCFGDRDPLDHEFEELSKKILRPMLEHMNQEFAPCGC